MREFFEVFKYTFKDNVKKKTFIISTIIMLVIVIAAMLIPAIITNVQSSKKGDEDIKNPSEKSIVYLVDKSGYFEKNLQEVQKQFPDFQIKLEAENRVDSIKGDIKENGKSFLIVASLAKDVPTFEYFVKQYGDGPSPDIMNKVFKNIYATDLLKQSKVSDDTITKALSDVKINVTEMGKNKWGGYFSSIFIVMILFFAIYFYGYGVSMSVASEKTSRVMDIETPYP